MTRRLTVHCPADDRLPARILTEAEARVDHAQGVARQVRRPGGWT